MNCKNCKKKICKEYRGKIWFGWDGEKYCDKQLTKLKYKDPVKIIEESICQIN